MRDRLDRLRHHLVVGRDDEHDDVGDLRAARAHGRERLVARRVEERDVPVARQRDVIGADVLRDAARLARDDVGLPDVVEQRRLAVVDVTHDRDDRRTRHELFGRVLDDVGLELRGVLVLAHRLEAELAGDELDLIEVEPLVDRHHQAQILERELDDLRRGHLHRGGSSETVMNSLTLMRVFSLSFSSARRPAWTSRYDGSSERRTPFRPAGPFMPCSVFRMFACTAS